MDTKNVTTRQKMLCADIEWRHFEQGKVNTHRDTVTQGYTETPHWSTES